MSLPLLAAQENMQIFWWHLCLEVPFLPECGAVDGLWVSGFTPLNGCNSFNLPSSLAGSWLWSLEQECDHSCFMLLQFVPLPEVPQTGTFATVHSSEFAHVSVTEQQVWSTLQWSGLLSGISVAVLQKQLLSLGGDYFRQSQTCKRTVFSIQKANWEHKVKKWSCWRDLNAFSCTLCSGCLWWVECWHLDARHPANSANNRFIVARL